MGNPFSRADDGGDGGDAAAREAREAKEAEEAAPSFFQMIKMGYGEIVNAIVRPPRADYDLSALGPKEFSWRGRRFVRHDLQLTNDRGMKLECSHWEPHPEDRPRKELPCVIYLHGNSSCRLGALENLEVVLGEGMTMFALDLAGSGKSEGDWVTLGWYERDDVACVVEHLRASGTVSTIGLWGRSMGAATALLHGHRDPSIAAFVLDSSFADLRQLALEMVEMGKAEAGYRVPGWVVSAAIKMVRSSVQKKAALDIDKLRPIENVGSCFIPALFAAGEDDNFIAPAHSQALHDAYAGDKNIVLLPGDHNSPRPRFFHDSAAIFLRNAMQVPEGVSPPRPSSSRRGDGLLHSWAAAGAMVDASDDSALRSQAALEEEMIRRAMAASMLLGGATGASRAGGAGGAGDVLDSPGSTGSFRPMSPPRSPFPEGHGARVDVADVEAIVDADLQAALSAAASDARARGTGEGGVAWACSSCTFENSGFALACEMCGTPRPAGSAAGVGGAAAEGMPGPAPSPTGAPKVDDVDEAEGMPVAIRRPTPATVVSSALYDHRDEGDGEEESSAGAIGMEYVASAGAGASGSERGGGSADDGGVAAMPVDAAHPAPAAGLP